MAFRKFGGLEYNRVNNYVSSNTANNMKLNISEHIGKLNTKIVVDSHLDMNNQSIFNANNVYFTDGSKLKAPLTSPLPSSLTSPLPSAPLTLYPTLVYSSPIIYAKGEPPINNLSIREMFGYSGWYANANISWKFTPKQTRVSELKGVTIDFFNCNQEAFLVTIYTCPTGIDDYSPEFHSSMTYNYDQTIEPYTSYHACILIDEPGIHYSTFYSKGTFSSSDIIQSIAIETNMAEIVVNKINFVFDSIQSFLLVPP